MSGERKFHVGLVRGMLLCLRYQRIPGKKRELQREKRLKALVAYARTKSPFYANLYQNLPASAALSDLPVVNKRELMSHFDAWTTDRTVRLSDVRAFMQHLDNVGRKFLKRYLVFTTSGSTGAPLIALADATTTNIMGAINTTRAFSQHDTLAKLFARGGKSIGVFATGGFYLSNGSIRARQLAMPWKKRQMALSSALLPVSQIVAELNAFQPAMLGGYPSNLELLIEEQQSGRLHISPVVIMAGGEFLSPDVRRRLSQAFACPVQTNYSCTEAGTIANECAQGHLHINDDWVVVEPVDAENRPVPDGTRSDKLLITNLFNYAQPFIRYELTDRVIRHSEPCACGNPSPWLTLEGRNDDVLTLRTDHESIRIAPLSVYAVLKETPGIRRFQLLCYPKNRIELRIEPADGATRENAFSDACAALSKFFEAQGVTDITLTLARELPQQHPQSGKFKHIICLDHDSSV